MTICSIKRVLKNFVLQHYGKFLHTKYLKKLTKIKEGFEEVGQ